MRRGLLVVGLISVVAVIAWFVSRPGPTPPTPGPTAPSAPQVTSKWEATVAPRGEKSLTGRVTFKGQSVANAQVVAVAANAGEPLLTERPCTCELKCGKPMLSCDRGSRSAEVEEWLATRSGEAAPVGRATTDADGHFSLSGLGDEVVTLWAESDGAKQVGSLGGVTSGSEVTVELKPSRTLEGVVRRGDKPVAGALVTAVEAHLPRFFDAVTRADGTFTLSGVPEGSWVVFASEGDARALRSVFVRDYLPIELDLLSPRQVKGRVVLGSNDEPVPDVEVELGGSTPRLTRTDATGTFVFDDVRAQMAAFTVTDARGVGSLSINLDDGEPIVVRLMRGRTVRGRVVEEDGRAVANVGVEVRDLARAKTATTGPDGRFEVQRVSVGPVSTTVLTDGYLPSYETFTGDEVTLTLKRAAMLRGRVVRPGTGMVYVSARREAESDEREVDDTLGWYDSKEVIDGGFALAVVPGRYQVSVSGEGVLPQTREVRAPSDDLVFELRGGARLEGRVTNAMGAPEPGARLTARREDDSQFTETNQSGEFELGGLPAGEVMVSVVAAAGEWTLEKKVTLRDAETTRADFSPDPGAPLAGVVVDSLGAPVPEVSVYAVRVENESQSVSARTDAKGGFRLLGLPAGPVRLSAYAEGRDLTLETSAPNESLTLRLALKTEVVGRVVDTSGRPITSFQLHGVPVESPDGRFQQLAYSEQPHLFLEAKGYVSRKIPVTLKEGKNELGDLVLSTGRMLKGRVVDGESGEPIFGVSIRQEGNRRSGAYTQVDGRFELTVDPDGKGLRFEHRDYQPRTGPAPEQSPCEVALSHGLTLSVRVFDAAGKQLRSVGVRVSKGEEQRTLAPVNGVFTSAGFAPGTWTVVVASSTTRVWRPVQVELTQGSVTIDVREATDGVSFKVDVPDARFIGLVPGEVTITTYKDLAQQTAVLEVVEGVVKRVTPGVWTVLAVRSPKDEKGLLLSRTVIQVLAEGTPDVHVTPEWKPVPGLPGDE